ncbi:MAG: TatD family hydrolase [Geminicoccaceae bacterium]|nr:TatD family hydrolase [Geminicoccaceae bacterium]
MLFILKDRITGYGFDCFHDESPRAARAAGFRARIEAAQQIGLPLIVHTRDADDDTARMLEEGLARAPFGGVIHGYSPARIFDLSAVEGRDFTALEAGLAAGAARPGPQGVVPRHLGTGIEEADRSKSCRSNSGDATASMCASSAGSMIRS